VLAAEPGGRMDSDAPGGAMTEASGRVHPIMYGVHVGDWDWSGGRTKPWRLGLGSALRSSERVVVATGMTGMGDWRGIELPVTQVMIPPIF